MNNRKNEFKNRELIRLQGSEKEIDSLVAEAVKCYQNNEFDKAIDLYLNAKKQLETLYKTSNLPRIKTKIDNCDLSISKAYYYWAQKIYFDAVKSANASDYEVAIEKCKKAIEVYPPCKEKMEKIIEKYELLREKTLTLDKIKANTKEDPAEVREKRRMGGRVGIKLQEDYKIVIIRVEQGRITVLLYKITENPAKLQTLTDHGADFTAARSRMHTQERIEFGNINMIFLCKR